MSAPRNPSPHLVTTTWLAEHLDNPDLVVVDGSWYLPTQQRDAMAEYRAGHIPGAVHFDIDIIADGASSLPHMMPSEAAFGAAAGAMGISETTTIVVYDGAGLFSAPRVWFMFRAYGAARVFILDGGFPAWTSEGRAIETDTPHRQPARFEARLDSSRVVGIADVEAALADGSTEIVDARPAERFRGDAPEPRAGVRAGHMPGSRNLPFSQVVENGRLASPELAEGGRDGRGNRSGQAGGHELRVRRLGSDPGAGLRLNRQAGGRHL